MRRTCTFQVITNDGWFVRSIEAGVVATREAPEAMELDEAQRLAVAWQEAGHERPILKPVWPASSKGVSRTQFIGGVPGAPIEEPRQEQEQGPQERHHFEDLPATRPDLVADLERRLKAAEERALAAERAADRLRHGAAIEGDFVCPNAIEAD